MPKFYGGVRKYAIFRADFKHAVESRYSKRDAITFLRSCLQGKPLELIKGIGSDYDAAWEYLDSIYGDRRFVSDIVMQDILKFKSLRDGEDARFCDLVHTLKEIGLTSHMDNSHMLSLIEQKMFIWMTAEMKSRMRATALLRTSHRSLSVRNVNKVNVKLVVQESDSLARSMPEIRSNEQKRRTAFNACGPSSAVTLEHRPTSEHIFSYRQSGYPAPCYHCRHQWTNRTLQAWKCNSRLRSAD